MNAAAASDNQSLSSFCSGNNGEFAFVAIRCHPLVRAVQAHPQATVLYSNAESTASIVEAVCMTLARSDVGILLQQGHEQAAAGGPSAFSVVLLGVVGRLRYKERLRAIAGPILMLSALESTQEASVILATFRVQ